MFKHNKYAKWYYAIIEKATGRQLNASASMEAHHIIPRSLGGDNSSANIVSLTPREHFVCHHLLTKMTSGRDYHKMFYAFRFMAYTHDCHLSSRQFANLRETFIQLTHMRRVTAETRAKMSASKKITHSTAETRAKLSAYHSNRPQSVRDKMGMAHRGKSISQQQRDVVSEKLSGPNNGRAKEWLVEFDDGQPTQTIKSLKTWCKDTQRTFPGVFRTIKSGTFSQGVRVHEVK